MNDPSKQPPAGRRQTVALAVVFASAIAARVYLAAIRQDDPFSGRRLPDGATETVAFIGLACALAWGATLVGLRYLNRTAAVLMAALAGGLPTAHYNGLLGAVPGGLTGLLVVSPISRRLGLAFLVGVAALASGVASGAFALWLDPDLTDGPSAAALSVMAAAVATAGFMVLRPRRSEAPTGARRWARRLGKLGLITLVLIGMWLSLSVDLVRRARKLDPSLPLQHPSRSDRYAISSWIEFRPLSIEWLWPGPLRVGLASFVVPKETTDEGLRTLRGWTELTILEIRGERISENGLAHVSGLPSLEELAFTGGTTSDEGVSHLSGLSRLERLELIGRGITGRGLETLASLPRLQQLHLGGSQITADGLARLSAKSSLWHLSLREVPLKDDDLVMLRLFPRLASLDLNGTGISDDGMRHLSFLTGLQVLDLSRTRVTKRGLEMMSPVPPGLPAGIPRFLRLSQTALTDEDLSVFPGFAALGVLSLGGTDITDAGVATLAKIPGLTELEVQNTNITDAAIPDFEAMPSLRWLNISGTKVSEAGAARLRRAKPHCFVWHEVPMRTGRTRAPGLQKPTGAMQDPSETTASSPSPGEEDSDTGSDIDRES